MEFLKKIQLSELEDRSRANQDNLTMYIRREEASVLSTVLSVSYCEPLSILLLLAKLHRIGLYAVSYAPKHIDPLFSQRLKSVSRISLSCSEVSLISQLFYRFWHIYSQTGPSQIRVHSSGISCSTFVALNWTMSNATTGELVLISASVILTSLLVATSATKGLRHSHSIIDLCVATVLVAGCLCTALSALCLLYLRRVSLDSFSVAVIGLLPAAQVAPSLRLGEIVAHFRMRKYRTLRLSYNHFRYVRYARSVNYGPLYPGEILPTPAVIRRPSCALTLKGDQRRMWYGHVIRQDANAIHLLDFNNQSESFRWWKSILCARHVVADPEAALLDSVENAISAMRLAADIVVIGDFILKMHGDSLRATFASDWDVLAARKSGFAATCNAIFGEFHLAGDWGRIDEGLDAFSNASSLISRGRSYAAVFFVLAEKSILRMPDPGPIDWFHVVKTISETQDEQVLKSLSRKWLKGWGFRHFVHYVRR